jgi:hypothetical protein
MAFLSPFSILALLPEANAGRQSGARDCAAPREREPKIAGLVTARGAQRRRGLLKLGDDLVARQMPDYSAAARS